MNWTVFWTAFAYNWGNFASLAGLAVSIATFAVARKAKVAAEAAKAEARRQNLAEELQDAQKKTAEVGAYLHQQKWEVVHLRSQEVIVSCSQILSRRGTDFLSAVSRRNLLKVQQQSGSIAAVTIGALRLSPSNLQFDAMCKAQQKALELLSLEAANIAGIIEKTR